eukprot:CAMPEP_0171254674 /NCGR_PEP_ID=MMETSP0790-20130122/52357_1 /TAXON_ID=2925 /ORGANISM="Alexandrium catenella, Strain OF101" /LENGTH=292 /DNA_ID=CAMNT_0011722571 /DNA_START=83 /DNA_END=958 /DNA_ORIENTATION=-
MPVRGVDSVLAQGDAVEVDGLDVDVPLGHGEVEEAVHGAGVAFGRRLGGDAAAAARDEASHASEEPRFVVDLLVVRVARDQQVESVVGVQVLVPVRVVAAREVGDGDLPVRSGQSQPLLQPFGLRVPEALEPREAALHRRWTAGSGAVDLICVVLLAADVMHRVLIRRLCIHGVAVKHENVNTEALVGEVHVLAKVQRRHDPSALAGPRVGDLLVPSVAEHPPTVVVVPEHAEPRLAIQAWTVVDLLEDVVEQLLGDGRYLVHRAPAHLWDASPVEVVPNVQDQRGVAVRRA